MLFGVLTYQRSAAHQRQAASLGILQDYLKMAVEHPDLASRDPGQPVDAEYEWFATHALFTAETLSVLVGDDSAMEELHRLHREPTPRLSRTRPPYLWQLLSRVRDVREEPDKGSQMRRLDSAPTSLAALLQGLEARYEQ